MRNAMSLVSKFAFSAVLLASGLSSAHADLIVQYRGDHVTLNGSGVSTWNDQAAAVVQDATQGTSTAQPTYHATGFGDANRGYLSFDGTDFLTAVNLFNGGSARTVVVVYRDAALSVGQVRTLVSEAPSSPTTGTVFDIESRNDSLKGSPYLLGWNQDVNSAVAPVAGRITFAVASYDTTDKIRLAWAFEEGAVASAFSAATLNTANASFLIGKSGATGYARPMYGDIAEVRVYNTALSNAEQATLIASLQNYYYVPEPATLALFALGGVSMVGAAIRRRRTVA